MAEDESQKTIKLGTETWLISQDDAPVEFVDLICEARQFNGIIYLSFLQTIVDAGTTPEARVNIRMRMNLATAQGLHGLLGGMIQDALKAPDKSKAN
ncbi:MAG: hypothetical protein J0G95_10940 [Rhizobiales bacterium]|nr:hypothetical protein [Hyphomicrobiales bacterium]